jgi:hypothetical protein
LPAGCAFFVEKRLQDQRGRNLVDYFAMILSLVACLVKNLVGLMSGKPLVPEVNRQPGQLAKLSGKGLNFLRLRAGLSRQLERIAGHDRAHGVASREARQGAQIVARVAFSFECYDRLCRQAQLV